MSSVQNATPASTTDRGHGASVRGALMARDGDDAADAGRPELEQLGRMATRSRAEAEKAAVATRDVARLARLDRLTRLPALAKMVDRFAQAAALADRHDGRLAVLLIDLDGLVGFDGAVGRDAEDRLVVDVARRLSGSVRAADTVCRYADDQFVVLLTDVAHDGDALSASRNALRGLESGLAGTGVICSIGISFYPDHGHDVETLIGRADAAMYCAKAAGPGQCRSYSEAAVVECSAHLSVVSPVGQRVRRASTTRDAGANDELREINEELLRVSIRANDDRDRARHHLRIALDAADMGRWTLDLASGEIVRSVRHDRLFGYPALLPRWDLATTLQRFVPEDRAAVGAALHEARTIGVVDFERRIHRADDGSVRWLHVRGETVHVGGVASRIVGVVTDVTERRAVADQLRQLRRMEAIGQLTGSVAHDFNNLLLVIGGSVDLLARRLAAEERTDQLVDAIRRAVANGSRLCRQLLAFARRRDAKRDVVSIRSLMPAFEQLLQRAANESIVVDVACDEAAWPCFIDRDQLEVALLNLAVNARDAMPDGGALTMRAGNRLVDDATAARWAARGGEFVALSIADSGVGIDDDVLRRAFEPFFTTKPVGHGTGLGLSQVHAFAKESGGFVSIERGNEAGADRGTVVTIHLPRSRQGPRSIDAAT